jgi:hypothetical protein
MSNHLMKLCALQEQRKVIDTLERLAVIQARAEGATWQQIGDACGLARQNAHRKFAGLPQGERVEVAA